MNLRKNSQVAAMPKTVTVIETAESIAQTCGYNVETVRRIIRELGFSENGVKTVLTQEQAEAVKRRIVANLSRGTNNVNRPTTTVVVGENDPVLELASLYARIDEIKSARIATLEAENAEKADRLAIAKPKAEFFDQVADPNDALQMRDVAAALNIPSLGWNKLFELLRKKGVLDNRNVPYREYQDRGYFRVIEQQGTDKEGDTHINLKSLVYQRGVDFIRKVLHQEGAA
jgi:phage antirepressor YoqD-like protein